MSVGRKLLIGLGSFFSLAVVGAATSPPVATTQQPTPTVLSAQVAATPAATATPTPTQTAPPTPTPKPTIVATPKPAVVSAPISCGAGYYRNTYGNCVLSPVQAATAPAGASAQCVDGTYSFSQTRRGTCSHHGGVASWL